MIGGIFETIGQTLGGGKDKYFLELDDAAENDIPAIKKTAPKAVETAKKVKEVAEPAMPQAKAVEKKTKTAAQSGQQQAKKVEKSSSAKAGKATPKTANKQAAPAKAVEPASTTATDPRTLIVNALAASGSQTETSGNTKASGNTEDSGNVGAGVTNFATDYLMPQGNRGRRRPGPNLDTFKSMAKAINPKL